MKSIRKINELDTVEEEIFRSCSISGIACSLVCLMIPILMKSDRIEIYQAGLFSLIFMIGITIYYRLTKNMKFASYLICIVINTMVFPSVFILGGGVKTGVQALFIIGIYVIIVLLHGRLKNIFLGVTIAIDVFLIYGSFTFLGDAINNETAANAKIYAVAFTLIVAISNANLTSKIMKKYDNNKKDIELLNEKLYMKTITDYLTGLYNRQYLFDVMTEVYSKENIKFSIIMFDIDRFKMVNDTYGHMVGNDVLVAFSNILLEYKSDKIIPVRYGGEEFVVSMLETDGQQAYELAEIIRKRVEAEAKISDSGNTITVSGGICAYPPKNSIDNIISEADAKLYEAKNSGRNIIVK